MSDDNQPDIPTNVGQWMMANIVANPMSVKVADAVTIYPDGRVEIAEGVTLDEAAQRFWQAVSDVAGWRKSGE